jgi:hypothetical protein
MAASAAEILRLRGELEARFGEAIRRPDAGDRERFDGFRTGVPVVDGLLPGGVQRGTLSVWSGEATSGMTAALRALVVHACGTGSRVAVVDATRTLDASFGCSGAGAVAGLWVVRPPDAIGMAEGAWAAELLLRAAVFDLVIVDGIALEDAQAHRLRALARDRNAAVVVSVGGEGRTGVWRSGRGSGDPFRAAGTPGLRAGALSSSPEAGGGERPSPAHPHSSVSFRADVRLQFRRGEGLGRRGLERGGRYRSRARVVLAKQTSAPSGRERELEVTYEPSDRLCSHLVAPDRSAGRR